MEKSATCMPGRYTRLFTGFGSSVNFGVSCGLRAAGSKCPFPLLGVTRFLLAARRTLSFTHAVATSSPLFRVPLSALQHLCRIQIILGKAAETRVQLTIRGQNISRAPSFSFPLMHSIFIFASLLFFLDGFVKNFLSSSLFTQRVVYLLPPQ